MHNKEIEWTADAPPLNSVIILDFNRKSSEHIGSVSSLFVNSSNKKFPKYLHPLYQTMSLSQIFIDTQP